VGRRVIKEIGRLTGLDAFAPSGPVVAVPEYRATDDGKLFQITNGQRATLSHGVRFRAGSAVTRKLATNGSFAAGEAHRDKTGIGRARADEH
jgi:hypothetical protein